MGVVDWVSDLDSVSDIGRGYLIKATFEADGGIVIDYSFMADEEDLIQFVPGDRVPSRLPKQVASPVTDAVSVYKHRSVLELGVDHSISGERTGKEAGCQTFPP